MTILLPGVRETGEFRSDTNRWLYSETDPEINNAQQYELDMQQKRGQSFDIMGRDSVGNVLFMMISCSDI